HRVQIQVPSFPALQQFFVKVSLFLVVHSINNNDSRLILPFHSSDQFSQFQVFFLKLLSLDQNLLLELQRKVAIGGRSLLILQPFEQFQGDRKSTRLNSSHVKI